MRSFVQVNARQSVRTIVELVRQIQLSQIRTFLFFLTIGTVVGLTANVLAVEGDDEEEGGSSGTPEIVNFYVSFDGIDQYYVSGQVVGVEDPDGLTVEFGDYITGHSAQTEYGGYFGYLIFLAHGEEETFSATVTSHGGVASNRVRDWPG